MRQQKRNRTRNYPKIIFLSFIIFCISVLAWDLSRNGLNTDLDGLPASAGLENIAEPEDNNSTGANTETSGNAAEADEPLSAEEEAAAAFAQLRMEREEARDEELALLDKIIADEQSSPGVLEEAEARRVSIASDIENEITAESLLAAKGYGETVVMIGADQTTVIVDMEIDERDAAIIADIVNNASGCGFENVVIVKR